MNLAQTIQQHVANFPPEKQAEVLDFVFGTKTETPSKNRGSTETGKST